MSIAICVVAYNRLDSLKRCLHFLEKADYPEQVKLYISVDKSENTIVEDYARTYRWEHGEYEPVIHNLHMGLRDHILGCGDILFDCDALIVIEDDVVVAQSFYCYAKACVEKYNNDMNIAGISLYSFPLNYHLHKPFRPMPSDSDVYLLQNAMSWGQVWMKKQWLDFKNWYEQHKNDDFYANPLLPRRICGWENSWLKFHTAYCIVKNKYFIHPYAAYSTCFADVGEHTSKSNKKGVNTKVQSYLLYGEQHEFRLSPTVHYDSYFENEEIYDVLGYSKDELCIDFWGTKQNRLNKRYWLTVEELPFKVIKSFGLRLKPYEMNVINEIPGEDIYLYDTTQNGQITKCGEKTDLFKYLFYTKEDRIAQIKRKIKKYLTPKKSFS